MSTRQLYGLERLDGRSHDCLTSFIRSSTPSIDASPDFTTAFTKNGTVTTPSKLVVTVRSSASASLPPAFTMGGVRSMRRRESRGEGHTNQHKAAQDGTGGACSEQ